MQFWASGFLEIQIESEWPGIMTNLPQFLVLLGNVDVRTMSPGKG